MKINMLLVFLAAVVVPGAAVNAGNDSEGTWGLHEPLKNCVSCHGDRSEKATADRPELVAPVPKLCYGCHKEFLTPDGWVHGPVATGTCLLCHESHKTENKSLLRKPVPELCYQCHSTDSLKSVANHSDKSYQNCSVCHEGHVSPGRMLLKQDFLKTDAGQKAKQILNTAGVKGGLVVHIGSGQGRLTTALRANSSFLVHGLDTNSDNIDKARVYIRSENLYGPVSVAMYDGKNLPYSDNLANLVVTSGECQVEREEIARVLAPGGVAVFLNRQSKIENRKWAKPRPKDIDDWPQYLNKADNNAVAKDSKAGPPRFVQWVDKPAWCRSHMAIPTVASLVSGNGRLFAIEDTAPPDNPFLPSAFRIVARDAFNGKELWSRMIKRWESVTMYIKCQPLQQQRRMAVAGDILYCTLQLEGPVSALDAATGEILKTYENTNPTQEVAYDQGILYLNVGERFNSSAYNIVKLKDRPFVEGVDPDGPFHGAGFKEGYAPQIKDNANPISAILAVDPARGKEMWAIRDITTYTAGSLSIKGDYAVYQAANGLFCVNSKTGKRIWAKEKSIVNAVGHDSLTPGTTPNTVVITDDYVFAVESSRQRKKLANAKSTLFTYSLKDGKLLWQTPVQGNYQASCDICYVNGTLWVGGHNPTQYNVETGQVIKKIVQKMTGPMGHDRCYRNYITEKYFINSKTGGADFLELKTGKEFPNHWTRGGCGMGVLPANGLVYSTPYSCQCSMGAMFQGMNAYASTQLGLQASDQPIKIKRSVRLQKGPAYKQIENRQFMPKVSQIENPTDWPAYRCDGSRSGITKAGIPAKLSVCWEAKFPTKPSAITAAAGKVFACDIDTHTLYALDKNTGRTNWTYTADARVDSPPTYYKGMVLFGSRDGWVYCLRASDGALAWRFKDLPDKLIGAFGQLESAWPVMGSVLILNDTLYFAAGRCSYLDGGIFIYALNPQTGELLKSRSYYGPFDESSGFPVGGNAGFKNDILVTDGRNIYLRHKAFDLDLADAAAGTHIVASGGFLDGEPQHRTCWALTSSIGRSHGDILVSNGKEYYEVQGFPLWQNHSYFDPRRNGYTLFAGTLDLAPKDAPSRRRSAQNRKSKGSSAAGKEMWR
ncbi:MAG: outer membrane protein assembly factor BamB family protein, partial [Planctomycetota bacterium]